LIEESPVGFGLTGAPRSSRVDRDRDAQRSLDPIAARRARVLDHVEALMPALVLRD
jgi:hypothetical protein